MIAETLLTTWQKYYSQEYFLNLHDFFFLFIPEEKSWKDNEVFA